MGKFKKWLIGEFLPVWVKQTLLEENAKLKGEVAALEKKLAEQYAYIDGLEAGIRAQRRIVINTGREVSK